MQVTIPATQVVQALGSDWPVDLAGCNEGTIASLIRQGLSIIAQRSTASMVDKEDKKYTPTERHERVRKVLDEISRNEYDFGGGGGGRRLSEVEHELRAIVAQALVASGHWKKSAAEKDCAKDMPGAVADLIKHAARAQGKTMELSQIATVAERYIQKWTAQAQQAVEARKAALQMDISL
jgi:hypothetical protein